MVQSPSPAMTLYTQHVTPATDCIDTAPDDDPSDQLAIIAPDIDRTLAPFDSDTFDGLGTATAEGIESDDDDYDPDDDDRPRRRPNHRTFSSPEEEAAYDQVQLDKCGVHTRRSRVLHTGKPRRVPIYCDQADRCERGCRTRAATSEKVAARTMLKRHGNLYMVTVAVGEADRALAGAIANKKSYVRLPHVAQLPVQDEAGNWNSPPYVVTYICSADALPTLSNLAFDPEIVTAETVDSVDWEIICAKPKHTRRVGKLYDRPETLAEVIALEKALESDGLTEDEPNKPETVVVIHQETITDAPGHIQATCEDKAIREILAYDPTALDPRTIEDAEDCHRLIETRVIAQLESLGYMAEIDYIKRNVEILPAVSWQALISRYLPKQQANDTIRGPGVALRE